MSGIYFTCDVCGKPATVCVQDTKYYSDFTTNTTRHEPDGETHYYCSSHYRDSKNSPGGNIYETTVTK